MNRVLLSVVGAVWSTGFAGLFLGGSDLLADPGIPDCYCAIEIEEALNDQGNPANDCVSLDFTITRLRAGECEDDSHGFCVDPVKKCTLYFEFISRWNPAKCGQFVQAYAKYSHSGSQVDGNAHSVTDNRNPPANPYITDAGTMGIFDATCGTPSGVIFTIDLYVDNPGGGAPSLLNFETTFDCNECDSGKGADNS